MSDYVSADTSAAAEFKSFQKHANFYRHSRQVGPALDRREKDLILGIAEDAYSQARYQLPSDWMSYEHFERVCYDLERTSSPGYPYCLEKSNIGDWLGFDGFRYDTTQMQKLWIDVSAYLEERLDSIYRVFVKTEPHKRSKALENRWRLIICPPLYEQVAWTMVFGAGNDVENNTVGLTPSVQGMVLCGGGWKDMYRLFREKGLDCSLDKSAWDWTAHIDWLELDLELRYRLITSEPSVRARWWQLAWSMYRRAFYHPRLLLSNGMLFEQMFPGIMKSGCVNTISSNSHMQIFCHIYAALRAGLSVYPLPVAVGDDTRGKKKNTPTPEQYACTGAIVKEETSTDFVGHSWYETGPIPAYTAKHLYRFCEIEAVHLASFLESMVHLYAHDGEFSHFWRVLAAQYGVSVPSAEYIKFWYDYDLDLQKLWNTWHRC